MKHLLLASLLFFAASQAKAAPQSAEALAKDAAGLEAAISQDPGNIELYLKLGFIYTRLEKADEAQRAFESVVRLDPKKSIAHYMLGLIYEKKGLSERATAAWQACLDSAAEPHMRETARKHLHHLSGS